MDCDLRFADADAYQHHLSIVHRPHYGEPATCEDFDPDFLDNSGGVACSEDIAPDRVDLTWGFSDFPCVPSIPLHPSISGCSSPLSQRVLTRSSVGSRSPSRTLSPPPILSIEVAHLETVHPDHSESPDFEHPPLSDVPAVGTPLISSIDFRSPSSPRPDTPALFAPSQELNGASHSDQASVTSAKSPKTSSPMVKLPDCSVSPVSSSGSSTLIGEIASRMSTESENSPNRRPVDLAVPTLRLQVPITNGTSQTV
ncbi:hypothetical protein DFH29DRAFT_962933, partial [Suillus ampliporus]